MPSITQTQAAIRHAAGPHKRFEAQFCGTAFAPHRHDSYAICITMRGVQSFNYRGCERHSLAGELVILHPDELHDGHAGCEDGFAYRGISIEPFRLQEALGQTPLPFIEGGRSNHPNLRAAVTELLADFDAPLDDLAFDDLLSMLAEALVEASGMAHQQGRADDLAVARARDFILDHLEEPVSMDDLESAAGISRWQLSRDFRTLLGTSPYRFALLRRLDQAQRDLARGAEIAATAYAYGFADQAHFSRHFKSAYGRTPRQFQSAARTIIQ